MRATQGNIASAVDNSVGAERLFSEYARLYDAEEERNRVARWTRARNLDYLQATFGPKDLLLEIGCGTGTEAISLARSGRRIVATDAAPGMIDQVKLKLDALPAMPLRARVTPLIVPAAEINNLSDNYGRGSFDGAYSSFGPLNCEPDLGRVVDGLADLVRPGGRVVVSLLGRFCLWETLWYFLHWDAHSAFRRWGGQARATVRAEWSSDKIDIAYWSAADLQRAFAPHFSVVERSSLPWILPPQYLAGIFDGRTRLFRLLAAIEKRTANQTPANLLGDHIRLTLIRR